jgi:hypothetical protein
MATTTRVRRLVLAAIALGPGLAGTACGGAQPAPALESAQVAPAPDWTPSPSPEPRSVVAASAQTDLAPATTPAANPDTASDPSTVQELFDDTARAPAAALKAKTAAADAAAALAQGLTELAKRVAPGMDADGPLATGTLREKQSLQTDITLAPNRCYAILGYSRQIRDVDLYLLLPPGILAAQDGTNSSTPVIGGADHPICPAASVPVTYKLRIVADQGAGDVAVQLYSKVR